MLIAKILRHAHGVPRRFAEIQDREREAGRLIRSRQGLPALMGTISKGELRCALHI
jgi:hypothetical protein